MANEAIGYDDFADLAGPVAPEWFDALTDEGKERVLAIAWEGCAWVRTLSDDRIRRAFEDARSGL